MINDLIDSEFFTEITQTINTIYNKAENAEKCGEASLPL